MCKESQYVPVTYTVNIGAVPTAIARIEKNEDGKTQVILHNNIALEDGTMLLVAVYDSETRIMEKVCSVDLIGMQLAAKESVL